METVSQVLTSDKLARVTDRRLYRFYIFFLQQRVTMERYELGENNHSGTVK